MPMKREILFRGKRLDNGEWVYGNYCKVEMNNHGGTEYFIIEYPCDGSQYHIDPETVGQYIGLTDKNGVKIFEGDLTCYIWPNGYVNKRIFMKVIFSDGEFRLCATENCNFILWDLRLSNETHKGNVEVIGNIYDNHELIK